MHDSRLPPGPSISPFAQLRRLVEDPFGLFADAYREHGPLFTLRVLGQEPWVIAGDPDVVRTIFRSSADELHSDAEAMKFLLGEHTVLFRNGESHRRERRILTPPFKHDRMVGYAERMLARTDDAIVRLRPGQPVVLMDLMQDISLAVIVECVFGVSAPDRRDRLATLFARHLAAMQTGPMGALAMAVGGARLRGLIARATDLRRHRARTSGALPDSKLGFVRFLDTKAEMDAMLRDELARCRRDTAQRDDVLALLAKAVYDDGGTMDDDALIDELFALLIGGHETSAITLAWTLERLLRQPETLARLRGELDEAFGDGPVTARGVERLRYLPAVIDEALRLFPVATSIPRRLTSELEVGGYRLAAGTRVFPAPAVLHFRDDLWDDPSAFRPERFLGDRPSPFHYLPFGGGSRACLGRPFALVEMRLVLAELVRRVDFELAPHAATKPVLRGMLVGPSDGVPAIVTRTRERSSSVPVSATI